MHCSRVFRASLDAAISRRKMTFLPRLRAHHRDLVDGPGQGQVGPDGL